MSYSGKQFTFVIGTFGDVRTFDIYEVLFDEEVQAGQVVRVCYYIHGFDVETRRERRVPALHFYDLEHVAQFLSFITADDFCALHVNGKRLPWPQKSS